MAFSSTFDLTAANFALKELYDGQSVEKLMYDDHVLLAMLAKDTGFGGSSKPVPLMYGTGQGRSATFANAQANISALKGVKFQITSVTDYSIGQITNQLLRQMNTDRKGFLKGSKEEVDGTVAAAARSLSSALFRSGTGSIGQISTISTGVITLINAADVVQYEVNQVLNANATDGGTPRAAKGYVIAVDRSLGTVTVSTTAGGAAATPGSWAGNDYLLTDGDNNAKISGLSAWLPATAPGSTAFFGVDRTADTWRLGGGRYDGSSQSIEEALIDSSALVAREGGQPKWAVTNFTSFAALEKGLGSRVQYVDEKGPAEISFRGIVVNSPTGFIKVFPDRDCQPKTLYLLDPRTWTLDSAGDAPSILTYDDGMILLRVSNADAAEVRVGYYAQLECRAPGWNCNVTLGA